MTFPEALEKIRYGGWIGRRFFKPELRIKIHSINYHYDKISHEINNFILEDIDLFTHPEYPGAVCSISLFIQNDKGEGLIGYQPSIHDLYATDWIIYESLEKQ